MENETLKQLVLAKGREIAPTFPARQEIAPFVEIEQHYARYGYSIYRKFQDSDREIEVCRIHDELPANNSQWWIAAKILDIPTEMPIDEFEQDLTNRQYVHDLRQAFDAGGDWGFAKANGAKVHSDVAFNQFMEKEPQAPAHEPVPFFDSQLRELCVALGWQGGTYHQVLAEVKRLKATVSQSNGGIPQPPAFIFDPSKEWDVCDDCKGYSVVPGPCGTCGGRGTSRKGLEKVLSAITDWRKTVLQAWQKPTDTRTESHC